MNCKSNLFETYWAFLRCDIKRFPLCRLPIGYIEIDAVTDVFNSATNWLDANETIQANDEWIYTARFMKGDLTNVSPVGGGRTATDSNMSMWLKPNEGNLVEFTFGRNDDYDNYILTTDAYDMYQWHTYRMKLSTGEGWIDDDYIGKTNKIASPFTSSKLAILGCHRGNVLRSGFNGAMKEFILNRNGVETRHFVACLRYTDMKIRNV